MPLAATLILLVAAQLFDLASFIIMTARHGLAAELNPIVVALAQGVGLPGITLVKLALVVLVVGVVVIIAPKRRRLATAVLMLGITAGLLGGVSNIAST